MTTTVPAERSHRFSAFLHRHPGFRLGALLSAPMAWFFLIYLASLALLFMTAFWQTDTFSLQIVRDFTLDNIKQVFTTPVYRSVAVQTVMIATTVTVLCATLALPVAFFAAKVAKPRSRRLLVVLFLVPLWASYLVKAYAWRVVLSEGGLLSEVLKPLGLNGPGFGTAAIILVLTYLWLPYMILPIYASLDRLPNSLLDASGDLGARAGRTFRSVVFPIILPGLAAGSVFTFSLSMGDYIAVQLVGGSETLLGNLVYNNIAGGGNTPLGAALALISVSVITLYLLLIRRTGALKEL
ncbi:MAG: ABC transporter permease [Actinomycetes bacterium]|jgi:putative spermidine/putrescine transport system permease protein